MMTGKIAIAVLIVMAMFPWSEALASAVDYAQELKALENRLNGIEMAVKKIADLVAKDAEGTLQFYRETGEAIKRSNARVDSLEENTMELGGLRSRVDRVETQLKKLEADAEVPRELPVRSQRIGTAVNRRRDDGRGERPPSGAALRVFVFDVRSQGRRTEIRYYTVRDISVEDIRLPDYLVRGMERVGR